MRTGKSENRKQDFYFCTIDRKQKKRVFDSVPEKVKNHKTDILLIISPFFKSVFCAFIDLTGIYLHFAADTIGTERRYVFSLTLIKNFRFCSLFSFIFTHFQTSFIIILLYDTFDTHRNVPKNN